MGASPLYNWLVLETTVAIATDGSRIMWCPALLMTMCKIHTSCRYYMRPAQNDPDEISLAVWMDACGLDSMKVVLNTAILLNHKLTSDLEMLISHRSSLLLMNAPSFDIVGTRYSVNTP